MRFTQYCTFLMAAMLSTSVSAEESADTIRTAGRGDLEKVSNFLLFSSSKKFPVQVPSQVRYHRQSRWLEIESASKAPMKP